jgi:hypothetical protein
MVRISRDKNADETKGFRKANTSSARHIRAPKVEWQALLGRHLATSTRAPICLIPPARDAGQLGQQTRVFPKLFLIQFPERTLGKKAIYLP